MSGYLSLGVPFVGLARSLLLARDGLAGCSPLSLPALGGHARLTSMPSYLSRSLSTLRNQKQREVAQLDDELVDGPQDSPRLPPELTLQVIHLGSQTPNAQDRRSFLCNASLVCSSWRAEAQKLLWATPHLTSDKKIRSFLRSEADGPQTSILYVSVKTVDLEQRRAATLWMKGALVQKAVERCEGLGMLSIGEVKQLDPRMFQASTLSANITYTQSRSPLPSTHSFSLAMLQLDLVYLSQRIPSELIASLLGSATGIVAIKVLSNPTRRPLLALPEITPRLTQPLNFPILGLRFPSPSFEFMWPVLPILRECHSLIILSLSHAHLAIFVALPQPLNRLVLAELPLHDWNEEVDLLRAGYRSLSELKQLVISGGIASRVGLETLERECRVRGIQPSWAGIGGAGGGLARS
ncbi:hypothetical protein BCR35DRAFT_334136 [Leucosporidium creatinivorum]|uniref:F-box domain-containing protein n=1 Tax=Leucosporidium creatinivorum TaxID=106004 RepID=A0A1Y2EGQ4_9BASI|nr:hypothetical protein BCR35DRAFT_334136 [Leucosporidium creatinivorum]